jgi:hypothetical protein
MAARASHSDGEAFAVALSAAHPGSGLELAGDPPAWQARTMVERAHRACIAAALLLIAAWMSACTYSGRACAIFHQCAIFSIPQTELTRRAGAFAFDESCFERPWEPWDSTGV